MGERIAEASPDITLADHVDDIVRLVEAQDTDDVVLCGHSYAGMVLTGAADAIAGRLRAMVFLDCVLPESGQSMFDVLGPEIEAEFRRRVHEYGDGWLIPSQGTDPARDYGVTDPDDAAWLKRHQTGQPVRTFSDPLTVGDGLSRVAEKVLVRCEQHVNRPHLDRAVAAVEGTPGWRVERWPAVHDVMITDPPRVAALFDSFPRSA
jgi:pimeloyl-ACP methyl ester carboxylesterase